ncbi:methionine ABC transporter permease [Erysipelothrix urinaevulpis]|uniref:methionine ABC transporter permease n=1 Tax=Erysipelothrix urinaevulpis TaxID=2683717 RepID=UPI0013580BDA|nr:methionine ABC transporter permease [Erysipelothrix urinaevulpis]
MIQIILEHQNELIKALSETGILLLLSIASAIFIGGPFGILLVISKPGGIKENRFVYNTLNILVNIVRSFPFLLFIIFMIPVTRFIVGTSLGTLAASIPMAVVAASLYSRFVEQALLEVPKEIIDTALSLGASTKEVVFNFYLVEARSSLVLGLTSAIVSFISYSTVMGVVGGGGIGDFAMVYGYQRWEMDIMYTTIFIMIIIVQFIQFFGNHIANKLDRR